MVWKDGERCREREQMHMFTEVDICDYGLYTHMNRHG